MAGIFERISTILRANVNAMLDSAEDPEKTLDQIIRDMAGAIEDARGQVAEMIAREKLLQADLVDNRRLVDEWGRKAELAVTRNADDLAREALRRKLEHQKNSGLLETQWQSQHSLVEKLKGDLIALQSRYETARSQRDSLIARQRAARAMEQMNKAAASVSRIDPSSELKRMEDRIRLQEARASAKGELAEVDFDQQMAQLTGDSELETELALLKAAQQQKALPAAE